MEMEKHQVAQPVIAVIVVDVVNLYCLSKYFSAIGP